MVFTFWVLLSLLHARLFHFPIALKHTQDGFAALARMQEYLLRAEQAAVALPPTPALPAVPDKSALDATARVRAAGCSFSWRAASTRADADTTAHDRATSLLQGVSLELRDGELGCVVGPVGSGKSTLLLGLLRETRLTAGTLHVSARSIAYVSQTAWIYAATVRDNIVMGRAYEREWYNAVTAACALDHDLALLADGDATSVSNCTLSGGQRQRISLARAVYANADLYLLDDCLSALDTRVIRHIVDECL
ncbi:ATP-binding cassette domain-containing protein, partial [archaeon]